MLHDQTYTRAYFVTINEICYEKEPENIIRVYTHMEVLRLLN